MKKSITNCLTFLANAMAQSVVYENHWSPEFCCQENRRAFESANCALRQAIKWDRLTEKDCKELRFGIWEPGNPLRLIPIWLYKAIPVGTELTSITGEKIVFDGNNIDTDTRYGRLAWGIIPKPDK